MHHAEAGAGVGEFRLRQIEHHRKIVDAAEFGQELRMARIVVSGGMEGGLAQWRRHQAGKLTGNRAAGSEHDRFISGLAGAGVELALRGVENVIAADRKAGDAERVGRIESQLGDRADRVDHFNAG